MQTSDLIFSFVGHPKNAISDVTEGYCGGRINHMGVIVQTPKGIFVLEAYPPEVRLTNIRMFLTQSKFRDSGPRYMLGRIQQSDHHLITGAIEYGLAQRDVPYDHLYLTDEDALYCSELVIDMFRASNNGVSYFPESPMNFRDTETGQLHETWISYYRRFGMEVPEKEPGSNPGEISLDERLDIYEVYGPIPGYISP